MHTKIEWQARVNGTEPVDSLTDFADEVLRGLVASDLVPDGAWIETAAFDFTRKPYVVIRWDTQHEMDRNAHTSVA